MVHWFDVGAKTETRAYRENFVRIVHTVDGRYRSMREGQLADWLKYPCTVPGYEHDHLYAFGGFRTAEDVANPLLMQFALLLRHEGAVSKDDGTGKGSAQLLMLGWSGASADPTALDGAIDAIIQKGIAWLKEIDLADQPVRCFRPYATENGLVGALHDRAFARTQMIPPRGVELLQRIVLKDGEFWKVGLSL